MRERERERERERGRERKRKEKDSKSGRILYNAKSQAKSRSSHTQSENHTPFAKTPLSILLFYKPVANRLLDTGELFSLLSFYSGS